jgi:hypothetical protein
MNLPINEPLMDLTEKVPNSEVWLSFGFSGGFTT